ncbi:hypothetical protein F5876DRAFT_79837 [Lentinula aff. lateritia]|uniref:Uncharacterized protein n=2 Tax=Lentinula aff. lateritia TaxID=2804960 RepID=A0ACC1TRG0_9AGAR|nr:hypothetical protein F5876DRAFT_48317 [Lentinula aff. lateritia]KAJ3807302.1 hypothetical protein F5876DRAFT_79837 [Lentinula aff. lateritia]
MIHPNHTPNPRQPLPGREYRPSDLRKHSLATKRLHTWTSPWAIEHRQRLSESLPLSVIDDAHNAMQKSLAPNTLASYAAGPLRFNQYCDSREIPEEDRMPAHPMLIAGFVGHNMGKVSGSCIKNWLSGLRAWFEYSGAQWPSDSPEIKMARKAAKKEGTAHKRPIRHPITLAHLLALYRALDTSNSFHCAIWALALVTFWGCRRLGELTIPSRNAFDPKFHVSRNIKNINWNDHGGNPSVHIQLPWSKSTREDGTNVVVTRRGDVVCAYDAFAKHLRVNDELPDKFSLFAYIDDKGIPQHMVKHVFLTFCYGVWEQAAMRHVLGHSFRIGGAVELLLAGVSPEVVAMIGGWTSLAFLLYWRRMEHIIPTHLAKAYSRTQIDAISDNIEQYRKKNKVSNELITACMAGLDITNVSDDS